MSRTLKRSIAALALFGAVWLGSGGEAHAWYRIKNSTPNTVWVAHAYASTSAGFFCGWNDGCDDNTSSGWRIAGWWAVAPGATSTIQSMGFGNAVHQIYANDYVGHVWGGNGGWWGTPNTAFYRCEGLFSESQNMPYYTYVKIRTSWCCGGSCIGDYTTTLIL